MLLLCLMVVGVSSSWGQSDNSATYTSNITLSTTGGTSASTCKVKISNTDYDGIKCGATKTAGAMKLTAPVGTKYLHIHVAGWNGETVTLSVSPNTSLSPTSIDLTADSGISGSGTTYTLGGTLSNYYKVITFTNALESNTELTFTATNGKRFVIWGVNSEAGATTPTYALTITEPVGGTITVLDKDNNPVSSGDKFAENALLQLSASASTGYTFSTWTKTAGAFDSDATVAENMFTMPGEAATIGATFTKNSYNLTLMHDNGTCTVTVDGEDWDGTSKIPYDAAVVITATPNSGYLFEGWISDLSTYDELTNPLTFNMPAGDVEVDASFADASSLFSITVDGSVTGGTISADKNTAAENATVTLTATPATGYTFTSWNVKDAAENTITVTNNQFTMPASNVTVTATFTPIAVTGVTLNKTSASLSVGETETLTATVAPANALNQAITWTSSNTDVATVSAAGVVTAVAAGSATITVTTDDGSFTATCSVTVVNAVTFDATSDTGTSLSKSGVSFTTSATESSTYKFYKNTNATFAVSAGKITKIEFTNSGGSSYKVVNGFTTETGTLSTDGNNGVWTGSASSITFTATGNQVRVSKIKVFVATTSAPIFSVAEGKYSEAKSVTISCATDGASIYYTMDGSTPTSSSTAYSSAIAITESTTLKAIAIKDGVESDVASATYTMNRPEAPTFDVAEGTFASAFTLHLATATDGATIYYTTDGTTPTSSNSAYTTGIDIPAASTTVKAVAVKNGLTSDVATAAYTYDTRPAPSFTLSATSIDLKVKETSSAVTLTTNSDGAVTFACADAHITLTGTGNSRTIKADAAGIYTVTVSTAATSNYLAGNGTITVNVTKKATTMVLATSFTSLDLYVTTSGSVTGTVKYGEDEIDGAEVTYSSSDETVATVASNGAVTFKKAGNTTITASYAGDDEYAACEATYELKLYDTTPQATEVAISFNNTFFGCSSFTNWTTGTATTLTGINKKVEVTYAKGSSQNMYCSTEQIRCYSGNSLSFTAPAGYFLTAIEFTSGTWNTATPTSGSMNKSNNKLWEGSSNTVSFSWSSTARIESATVTIAPTVTITAAKYATYCSPHKLDFSATGITVYKAKVNGSVVKMTEISDGIVPANTGVILYKDVDAATTIAVPVTTTDATITDNELVGTTVRTLVAKQSGDNFNYILQNGQDGIVFNMATAEGAYMPANRAYLSTAYGASAVGARLMVVFDEGDTTGIDTVNSEKVTANSVAYDLQGRRVVNPKKGGLYIVNGKKVVVK